MTRPRGTDHDAATGIVRDFRHVPLSTFEALALALGVDVQTTTAPDPELVTFFRSVRDSMNDARVAGNWDSQTPAN